jgi:hypothetical protein
VSTTLIAGVELIRRGMGEPVGSLTQLGTVRLGRRTEGRTPLVKELVSLAELDDHNATLRNALRHIIDRHEQHRGLIDRVDGGVDALAGERGEPENRAAGEGDDGHSHAARCFDDHAGRARHDESDA